MPLLANRVTVTVHASDPLSRAGVISHLQHQPTVEVLRDARETRETDGRPADPAVAVMLVDQVDDSASAELRRVVRGGEQRVVLIARELREPDLLTVVEYGVRAILWRHQATEQRLLKAVHSAARGEGELPPDLISRLLVQVGRLRRSETTSASAGSSSTAPLFGMAPREVDVLRLVAEGLDTRQISEKLAYSERTVKNILHALMTRLQLTNRAHAVAYALREGYI
ncbi:MULTISPECIES: response regulator transcription factor [unclassified Streptomyces]|uniref:helix-turn-helix transcriptional regulator n=1 Tax=unclassified Streptomyces TaxID=2593676 RepID=UPI0006ADB720|nr:response regulator transcription factor [Streptomyces sp. WM6378]KOU34196.1 LuxR family transcriptional regulator [Streptomyces sp. WM6378]